MSTLPASAMRELDNVCKARGFTLRLSVKTVGTSDQATLDKLYVTRTNGVEPGETVVISWVRNGDRLEAVARDLIDHVRRAK